MAELELRHLRTLCAIAETGSLTKAAARLGLTQPALSAQLRSVERIVGGLLFERKPTGSELTDLGKHVVSTARVVLDDVDQLVDLARDRARGPDRGPLLVGSIPTLFLGSLVSELRSRFAGIQVRTNIVRSSAQLLEDLIAGRLHLAVLERFEGLERREIRGVEMRTLVSEPQFIAVPANDALAEQDVIDLCDLAGMDWVTPPPEQDGLRMLLHTVCAAAGFTPRRTHHTTESSTAWSLVAQGAACFADPATPSTAEVAIRPLSGQPILVPLLVATRQSGLLGGRAQDVYACAARAYMSIVDLNPDYARWWAEHPRAHAELDAALRVQAG
ncbi:LysR family transcriptional regulator [Amycolatopsis cihanbeyliensis]|uniref:DNA-binding transcriptional LysR family regulator n=1 Tax=Amycolatopsis cihanbeyliensis TaxID=1128664 RepID=A0A542DHC4_AMYCI|nr:LysR family transcriptional regulator [Amycolatopsis cihanbeyliensis]TQJ02488.1 DNA-binding transcriptional LysR family regulator [Amycolatopsis cihanbeyliensis]